MDDPKLECLAGGLWIVECQRRFLEECLHLSGCRSSKWIIRYRKSHFHFPCPRLCRASSPRGLVWGKQFSVGALLQNRKERVLNKYWFTHRKTD